MADTTEMMLRTLRNQAWERAKGELRACLQTFYGDVAATPGQFGRLEELINQFIETVEEEGLEE